MKTIKLSFATHKARLKRAPKCLLLGCVLSCKLQTCVQKLRAKKEIFFFFPYLVSLIYARARISRLCLHWLVVIQAENWMKVTHGTAEGKCKAKKEMEIQLKHGQCQIKTEYVTSCYDFFHAVARSFCRSLHQWQGQAKQGWARPFDVFALPQNEMYFTSFFFLNLVKVGSIWGQTLCRYLNE